MVRRGALGRLPLEELPSPLGGQPGRAVAAAQRGPLVRARRPGNLRVLLLGSERLPGFEPATILRIRKVTFVSQGGNSTEQLKSFD